MTEDEPDYAEIGRRGAALARHLLTLHRRHTPTRDQPWLPDDLANTTPTDQPLLEPDDYKPLPDPASQPEPQEQPQ